MKFSKIIWVFLGLLCMGVLPKTISPVEAQRESCPAIAVQALNSVDQFCSQTDRNQACYGNFALTGVPQAGVSFFDFDSPGDIVNVSDLQSMTLRPLDQNQNEWGVALMRLQANIPDTLPGQNVTFLLFGDVEIGSQVARNSSLSPMQAFYFRSGVGDAPCEEVPESGLLVQTPEGVGSIELVINDVNVLLGSTAFIQGGGNGRRLVMNVIEGNGSMEANGKLISIPAGWAGEIYLDQDGNPIGEPNFTTYSESILRRLPIHLLDRPFRPTAPGSIAGLESELQKNAPLTGNWAGQTIEVPCLGITFITGVRDTSFTIDNNGNLISPRFTATRIGAGLYQYNFLATYMDGDTEEALLVDRRIRFVVLSPTVIQADIDLRLTFDSGLQCNFNRSISMRRVR